MRPNWPNQACCKDAMLNFLFRGLTAEPEAGAALFAALTAEARRPGWYVEGQVPDTLDGRFAVLATVIALAIVRLEQEGGAGNAATVALTERFIQVMESEHRELGLGDPTLGKTVRKLVGSLARRTESWRGAVADRAGWRGAAAESLYKPGAAEKAIDFSAGELEKLYSRLQAAPLAGLRQGKLS